MFYNPSSSLAFASIVNINNDIYLVDELGIYMLMVLLGFFWLFICICFVVCIMVLLRIQGSCCGCRVL